MLASLLQMACSVWMTRPRMAPPTVVCAPTPSVTKHENALQPCLLSNRMEEFSLLMTLSYVIELSNMVMEHEREKYTGMAPFPQDQK